MEQQSRLKQRLVGAIVLVALGVIFIPMILDGEREQGFIVNGSSIPAQPAEIKHIRQVEFAAEDTSEGVDDEHHTEKHHRAQSEIRIPVDERSAVLSTAEKVPAPANNSKANHAKTGKATDKVEQRASAPVAEKKKRPVASVTHAWAVQVGSFKQKSNALKLRDKLRKQKYKAFVEGLRNNAGIVYRVRLGPYVSHIGAEQVRDKLLARQKMKGLVVRHP